MIVVVLVHTDLHEVVDHIIREPVLLAQDKETYALLPTENKDEVFAVYDKETKQLYQANQHSFSYLNEAEIPADFHPWDYGFNQEGKLEKLWPVYLNCGINGKENM